MPRRSDSHVSVPESNPIRLQKALAQAGLGSRRHCEEYILAGRVEVDGKFITDLGTRVDPSTQKIAVDGQTLRTERKYYFLLNKPKGYLCTNNDPAGRPRAIDLFPADMARLFTVGRLDENSQGLLFVTNDGELGNLLAHPRYRVPKTYRVQVAGNPTRETLEQLRRGLYFAEGKFTVQSARALKSKGKSTFLEIVLNEGQNREIRRLFARVGHKVIQLERIAFGPLRLGHLAIGKYRPLKAPELKALRDLVDNKRSDRASAPSSTSSGDRKRYRGKQNEETTSAPRSIRDDQADTPGSRVNGKRATGKRVTGTRDTGKREIRARDTQKRDTAKRETGKRITGTSDTGKREIGARSTGARKTSKRPVIGTRDQRRTDETERSPRTAKTGDRREDESSMDAGSKRVTAKVGARSGGGKSTEHSQQPKQTKSAKSSKSRKSTKSGGGAKKKSSGTSGSRKLKKATKRVEGNRSTRGQAKKGLSTGGRGRKKVAKKNKR